MIPIRRGPRPPVTKSDYETVRRLGLRRLIGFPVLMVMASRITGLPLHYAAACLEKETGGRNVYGHDPTFPRLQGKRVTWRNYTRVYLPARKASGNRVMQGVGPLQLTWWATQDTADREGGCWVPWVNMIVGYRTLWASIRTHGPEMGAAIYNGGPSPGAAARRYGADFMVKAAKWQALGL